MAFGKVDDTKKGKQKYFKKTEVLLRNEKKTQLTGRTAAPPANAAVRKPTHAHDALLNGFKTPTFRTEQSAANTQRRMYRTYPEEGSYVCTPLN